MDSPARHDRGVAEGEGLAVGAARKGAVVRDAGDTVVAEDVQLRDGGERGRVPVEGVDGHVDGRVRVVESLLCLRVLDDHRGAWRVLTRDQLGREADGEGAAEEWEECEESSAHLDDCCLEWCDLFCEFARTLVDENLVDAEIWRERLSVDEKW